MARLRSPNYPAIGLPEAIDRVRKLHERQHQTPEEREVVAQHLGYGGLNGKSLKIVSALTKYGLLEKTQDGRLRVTDRAIDIIAPEDGVPSQAICDAAFSPDLFSDIRERWPDHSPTDESLRAYLIRRQFAQSAISDVIHNYRETSDLVTQVSTGSDASKPPPQETKTSSLRVDPSARPPKETAFHAGFDGTALEGTFRLTTPEDIDTLIKFLKLNKAMITPVRGGFETKYSDDEEGRAAQERDEGREQTLEGDE